MYRKVLVLFVGLAGLAAACARDQRSAEPNRPESSRGKVYRLEELSAPQVDALDRDRTLFILPVGMVEVHGPHLPIGNDTIGLIYEANLVSARLGDAVPDWNVVMMPPINYGQAGANELAGRLVHPGTYAIRQTTLRSIVADLGGEVARNGFKWVFVLNGHGSPTHNIAISEACDFVSETFRVTMLHVTAMLRADAARRSEGQKIDARHFSAEQLSSFGMDIHAGVAETSGMLAIRPELVSTEYRTLPPQTGRSLDELREIARAPGWQGYFSDPAKATAAHGRDVENWWVEGFTGLILRAVRGENLFTHPRFPETVPPQVASTVAHALESEAAFESTLAKWLARRSRR